MSGNPLQLQADRSVRPAVVSDAPFIARMQAEGLVASLEATLEAKLDPNLVASLKQPQVEQTWRQTLSAPTQADVVVLTAVEGAAVCGFALGVLAPADKEHAELSKVGVEIAALEVSSEHLRTGHGSRLLAAVNDSFKGRAHHLNTWICQADDARISFFQSAGFAPSGLQRKLAVGEQTVIQHLWWALS
ncbi:GNAT family N-acetyltransferase [Gleimia sp. 6138-11-ORH1]|uniref:GNAT family N-acetyltransferase n=1 Tax=Gleimia sp. 6138-11-ORH1 TaxID=2973937 RepID=UPI002169FDF8|nr:GNAT family N-acetyltransferase [Gleimia sp. 6138-11-ORH1]MCS4484226.1 GNAT family N-acetyltransferase [Gleimia sp. 6138-11-ORH1]